MAEESIDQGPLSPSIVTFDTLQAHSTSVRRARPPNIIVGDDDRVPLRMDPRSEKLAKRESKIGLRSIFGRQKTTKDGMDLDVSTSARDFPRSGGIRASLAEIGNWPYSRSDLSLTSPPPPSSSRSTSSTGLQSQQQNPRLRQQSGGKSKPLPASPGTSPGAWAPPPLFQVYPQAVKHATLPACTASVEALLRLTSNRNSLFREESAAEESGEKKDEEKGRKLHQRGGGSRSILNWTSKTYALTTSGYLLQYAAEGPFDRLPEKILRLSKGSVAFASDLIPGRHWVIQVVLSMDANGTPTTETRSFISKLALRGSEKKNVSTLLMVFESAQDMDSWLAVLRREIEELGGRKQLTETGEVKEDGFIGQLKSKPSQRTIVVRDPERFSTMVEQDFSWSNDNALKERDHGLPSIPSSELSPEFLTDDGSLTESHYSSDGQALDSLRESNNRFSHISSGQRTYVTSANSSPSCSPTRASFSSHPGDPMENQIEVRLRPNAQAISSRRQSMQTIITGFDVEIASRRHSTISNATDNSDSNQSSIRQSVPNFSKRFSGVNASLVESVPEQIAASPPKVEQEPPTKSSRRPPPTALAMSRPLSTVMDMPTPISPHSPYRMRRIDAVQRNNAVAAGLDLPSLVSAAAEAPLLPSPSKEAFSTPGSKIVPRRFVSMTSLRTPAETTAVAPPEAPRIFLSSTVAARKAQFESALATEQEPPRSFSSMGVYGPDRKLAPRVPSYKTKRSSFMADDTVSRQARQSLSQSTGTTYTNYNKNSAPRQHPVNPDSHSSSAFPPNHFLNVNLRTRGVVGRRSMPQLAEGPPLAPPPTCALPPIPKKC